MNSFLFLGVKRFCPSLFFKIKSKLVRCFFYLFFDYLLVSRSLAHDIDLFF
ncbi:hypothetical protein HMPREF1372_00884 [Enterococcus faecium P1139]|nr:hypothetical protein HMPREF1372_00884 [Enterococcus faecium P1139]